MSVSMFVDSRNGSQNLFGCAFHQEIQTILMIELAFLSFIIFLLLVTHRKNVICIEYRGQAEIIADVINFQ